MITIEQAHKLLDRYYKIAKAKGWTRDPVSHALFSAWSDADTVGFEFKEEVCDESNNTE